MDEIKVYVIGENASSHSLAALMAAYQSVTNNQHIVVAGGRSVGKSMLHDYLAHNQPNERELSMLDFKRNTRQLGDYLRAIPKPMSLAESKTPTIPLPMSYRTDKEKYTPTVNSKKHLATCAKNRKKRKSKRNK